MINSYGYLPFHTGSSFAFGYARNIAYTEHIGNQIKGLL